MATEVIVPLGGSCPHRRAAWEFCRTRYPWPVRVSQQAAGGPWNKALAVMPAIEASDADVIVMADADVWTDGLAEAVAAVEDGAGWAIPHRSVHRLTEDATAAYIAGADPAELELDQRAYMGVPGGGYVVARRETLLECCLDARFVGWGQEDDCHAMSLTTLHGQPWRPTHHAPLWHCWHPPQQRLTRVRGSFEGWELRRRYHAAQGNPQAMNQLLQEARDALELHHRTLHPAATG